MGVYVRFLQVKLELYMFVCIIHIQEAVQKALGQLTGTSHTIKAPGQAPSGRPTSADNSRPETLAQEDRRQAQVQALTVH